MIVNMNTQSGFIHSSTNRQSQSSFGCPQNKLNENEISLRPPRVFKYLAPELSNTLVHKYSFGFLFHSK
jgi:hypothetical protein